jgi:hypothetical protein
MLGRRRAIHLVALLTTILNVGPATPTWLMTNPRDTVIETAVDHRGAPGDLTNIYGWKWMNEHVPQPASCSPKACHRRNTYPRRA